MHKFLRAIGFSDFKKKDLEIIIKEIIDKPQVSRVVKDTEGNEFAELSREYSNGLGLKILVNYIDENSFQVDNYFPYYLGESLSTQEKIEVEKHYDKESYAGICDDAKLRDVDKNWDVINISFAEYRRLSCRT